MRATGIKPAAHPIMKPEAHRINGLEMAGPRRRLRPLGGNRL